LKQSFTGINAAIELTL